MGKVKEYWATNEKKWELMEMEYYYSHLKERPVCCSSETKYKFILVIFIDC